MDFVELLINLNVLIGLCYFLLSALLVILPAHVKSLRVLGLWGLVLLVHAIIFLIGCGLHHLELEDHVFVGELAWNSQGIHLLTTSLMQVYGALGAAAVGIFKGEGMMDRLKQELVKAKKKKDV